MGTGSFARTVIEENCVSTTIDGMIDKHPRVGQLYDGLKWRLARAPESGVKADKRGEHWVIKTKEWKIHGLPVIRAVYIFDDNHVTILDIAVL